MLPLTQAQLCPHDGLQQIGASCMFEPGLSVLVSCPVSLHNFIPMMSSADRSI